MQNLNIGKQETPLRINLPFIQNPLLSNSFNFISPFKEENKQRNDFLGKKITNDADLISWLSGKDIDSKKYEVKCVPEELNSKVKKKLRNKLIKNAKKCELYFVRYLSEYKYINISCIYCLKNIFDHNELLRFTNFEDFVYYLKYIFYLSDKVFSYSLSNFKNNKKESDNLFSRFKSNEENWNFSGDKYICKLCIFKLVNNPNLIQNMKDIFLKGKNEVGADVKKDMFLMINSEDINDNIKKNENIQKKNKNNNYEFNSSKQVNIYNSNNININIENTKIINNYANNNNNNEKNSSNKTYYDTTKYSEENNNNQNVNTEEINMYWKQYFFINHYKIITTCNKLNNEIIQLSNYIQSIYSKIGKNLDNNEQLIIKNSQNRTLFLFKELIDYIIITNNCLNIYKNDLSNFKFDISQFFDELMNQNRNNYNFMESIILIYNTAINSILFE